MIYLDNAATTFPKPEQVYTEVLKAMKYYGANPGRSSHDMAIKASSKVIETRELLAKFFNIQNPFNIIFTSSATESLNIGIKGILKSGDHVISTVTEHNSVLRPLNRCIKKGVKVTLVGADQYGRVNINNIKNEIRKNTKLIVVNHASNVLGTIQRINEIGQIAKKNGILFMVDASQSAGMVSIDVEKDNIDLMGFPGHKGLYGPMGTGALFIRDGIKTNFFKEGGTGSNSNSMDQPDFMPDKFESGTLNVPGIAGLCEGIKFVNRIGRRNIKKHEEELTKHLIEELKKLDFVKIYGLHSVNSRCGVVSITVDGIDSSTVGYSLNERGIAVRTGFHCAALIHGIIGTHKTGTVRASIGYFNTHEHIEKFIEAIEDIYKSS